MRHRKLYQLLVLLDEPAQMRFEAFLASPLFNSSPTQQTFFACWRRVVLPPRGDPDADHSPEELLAGTGLLPARMDKYCSGLYRLLTDFLALEGFLGSERAVLEQTARSLQTRNAPQRMREEQQERLQAHIDASPESGEKMLRRLEFHWEETSERIGRRETRELWKEDFRGLHEAIDSYYYLQKLRLACASANARLIYRQDEDPASDFLAQFRQSVDPKKLPALTRAYWAVLQLYSDHSDHSDAGDESAFRELFRILKEEGQAFGADEGQELFGYALNYCMARGNRGETVYDHYSAALYRELLDREIILVDGKLPPQAMKNIVVIHCVVGELDWVADFLIRCRDLLPPETDPQLLVYNEGVLAFYRADFPTTIDRMRQVISQLKDDIFYELDARIYLLKAKFEYLDHLSIEEVDEMYRMYDSFRIFIARNDKLSDLHKARYGNFIREFKRFLKLLEKPRRDASAFERLYAKVLATDRMVNKSWFLEKLNAHRKPAS